MVIDTCLSLILLLRRCSVTECFDLVALALSLFFPSASTVQNLEIPNSQRTILKLIKKNTLHMRAHTHTYIYLCWYWRVGHLFWNRTPRTRLLPHPDEDLWPISSSFLSIEFMIADFLNEIEKPLKFRMNLT